MGQINVVEQGWHKPGLKKNKQTKNSPVGVFGFY
jgi:hypothetical protein